MKQLDFDKNSLLTPALPEELKNQEILNILDYLEQ